MDPVVERNVARYRAPDLRAPFDLEAHLALAPPDGLVKGMFFESVAREVRAVSGRSVRDDTRYHAFASYPLRRWLTYLHDAALTAYPREPVRAGLRRLGHSMFPTFSRSMVGKVVFSVAGGDLLRSLPLYPKIWSIISNHARAEVDELQDGRVVIRQRNVWDFVDSFQLGSLEGGMQVFGKRARVRVHVLSPCDADFEVTW